jgi:nucleoside-diphosphate-sugar epimerase
MKKTIFLTGASSSLGLEFYENFKDQYIIYRIYRNLNKLSFNEFNVDLTNKSSIESVFSSLGNIDTILHFSAQPTVWKSIKNPLSDAYANIISTLNLLDLAVQFKINNFVFTSSESVYGDFTSPNESTLKKPNNPYGISKYTCENYIRFYKNKYNINGIIIRPSFVISTNMNRNPLYDILSNFKTGKVNLFQSIKSKYNFVLASTVCSVINDILLGTIKFDEINVVNKKNLCLSEIINYLKNKSYEFEVSSNEGKIVDQTLSSEYPEIFLKYENDIFNFCDNYIKNN